jgi:hypothetical protein
MARSNLGAPRNLLRREQGGSGDYAGPPRRPAPSSSGLGHHPLKVAARVRIPLGLLAIVWRGACREPPSLWPRDRAVTGPVGGSPDFSPPQSMYRGARGLPQAADVC